MIGFVGLFIILFFILAGSNLYYYLLTRAKHPKKSHHLEKNKHAKKSVHINILLPIALVISVLLFTIFVSLTVVHLIAKNTYIIYMGVLTAFMLFISFYSIFNKNKLLYSVLLTSFLISLQLYLKDPLFGGLLIAFGYIGVVNYILHKKNINPKIILFFLILYMLYDLITVFITPLQPALANKTLNNIFPSALIYKKTLLGLGDVLFTLIMTIFSRVNYGLNISILTAFLVSFPLVLLGIFFSLFPNSRIALPYLVLSTPIFLVMVFAMKKKGYKLN